MPELETLPDGPRRQTRLCGYGHLRLEREKGKEVAHKEPVLIELAQAVKDGLEGALAAAKDAQVEGHVAQRNQASGGVPHDPGVRAIVRERGQEPPTEGGEAAPLRD